MPRRCTNAWRKALYLKERKKIKANAKVAETPAPTPDMSEGSNKTTKTRKKEKTP